MKNDFDNVKQLKNNHDVSIINKFPLISVIIPVYKAEGCIEELYRRLLTPLETLTKNFEIIMIEDCGGDKSWDLIVNLAQKDGRIRGYQFSRNFGQHYGITAGLDVCLGDWVVVMDCDLQDRPEEILKLYQKAQEGYDVVLAKRGRRKDPILKSLSSWLYYKLFSYLTDIDYDGNAGNFCIISRRVVQSYRLLKEQLRFFRGIINWLGFPTASIEVCHAERFYGKSSYSFLKLIKLATDTIIAYSDKPLRLFVGFGFLISSISFIYGICILLRSVIYGSPIAGWSSLMISIYFIGGIIIAILGIVGVYLGKTFNEVKKRPLYIISRSING